VAASGTGAPRDLFKAAARPFGWVAVLALAFMVLMTCADVGLRALFSGLVRLFGTDAVYPYMVSFQGTVDLMELALTVCVFLALPGVFLRDENIAVDLIDALGSRRLTFALKLVGLALALALLVLALTQMILPALDRFRSGEGTMTLQLPRWWQAIPILLGFLCSALAVIAVAWRIARRGPQAPLERTRTSVD
jgi:TRAP-type C4-dicarboxylate transport system permease small subunit